MFAVQKTGSQRSLCDNYTGFSQPQRIHELETIFLRECHQTTLPREMYRCSRDLLRVDIKQTFLKIPCSSTTFAQTIKLNVIL